MLTRHDPFDPLFDKFKNKITIFFFKRERERERKDEEEEEERRWESFVALKAPKKKSSFLL
jgi:hypothetical protein